jgi:hypothetical protein
MAAIDKNSAGDCTSCAQKPQWWRRPPEPIHRELPFADLPVHDLSKNGMAPARKETSMFWFQAN